MGEQTDMGWLDSYLDGLTVALALGDWTSMERLTQWPDRDLRVERGLADRTPEVYAAREQIEEWLRCAADARKNLVVIWV
jgi:hypothetical protein